MIITIYITDILSIKSSIKAVANFTTFSIKKTSSVMKKFSNLQRLRNKTKQTRQSRAYIREKKRTRSGSAIRTRGSKKLWYYAHDMRKTRRTPLVNREPLSQLPFSSTCTGASGVLFFTSFSLSQRCSTRFFLFAAASWLASFSTFCRS